MSLQRFKSEILPLQHKLFRFAGRIVGNWTEAEDVVQEVLIKLWEQRQNWAAINNLEAWSMTLTKNLAFDKKRSKHRRTTDIEKAAAEPVAEASPYRRTETNDRIRNIKQWMEQLPENQKLVMHLRDVEGLSYQEICDALDMPMTQVKTNLFRARKTIREALIKTESYGLSANK